jgi:hypothetical protein
MRPIEQALEAETDRHAAIISHDLRARGAG